MYLASSKMPPVDTILYAPKVCSRFSPPKSDSLPFKITRFHLKRLSPYFGIVWWKTCTVSLQIRLPDKHSRDENVPMSISTTCYTPGNYDNGLPMLTYNESCYCKLHMNGQDTSCNNKLSGNPSAAASWDNRK